MTDLTGDLLAAVLAATPERKQAALRALRGEIPSADAETLRRCAGQAEPFLTLKECARRLNFTPCCLWRWQVPGHELGGRPRFRMSEIEAYLASDTFKKRAAELREEDRERRAKKSKQETVGSEQGSVKRIGSQKSNRLRNMATAGQEGHGHER